MFLGHHAVAFAAKRFTPQTSLGTLFAAAMFLDLIWPAFLLAGWEKMHIAPGDTAFTPLAFDSYPYSHSLVMTLVWSGLFAGLYWAVARNGTGAVAVAAAVSSHWVLDFFSHRPDMPIAPGSNTLVGLGLWDSVIGTLVVELSMFGGALWLYLQPTRAKDRTGRISLIVFVSFLLLLYFANLLSPPPPSWRAVATVGLMGWCLPLWAAWFDRHREISITRRPAENR